jgi:thymidylate synthase
MADGFPLLTTKKMAFKSIKVELEFFIKGLSDKRWLQERGCTIWNEWCNPSKIPQGLSPEERKAFQLQEPDLGKVYGVQWRDFNSQGTDQLRSIVEQLKVNPTNRQLVCSAWNPCQMDQMALPPCHILWHVWTTGGKLHLCWFQRSVDTFLGLPFNIASYALLMYMVAQVTGLEVGTYTHYLNDVHIYRNLVDQVRVQVTREPLPFPRLWLNPEVKDIFAFTVDDIKLVGYQHHPPIRGEMSS